MSSDHSGTLDHARLHRRVKRQAAVANPSVPAASAADPATAPGAGNDAAADTSAPAQPATTTTTRAAAAATTTTTAQQVIESTSSAAPSSSTTTAAPVESSTTAEPSTTTTPSTTSTTTTTQAPTTTSAAPTTSSTTTSSAPETTSSATSESSSSTAVALSTSDATSTTIVIVSGSAASPSSSSALPTASSAGDNGSSGSSSLGTGSVIGIVAGAVVGIIVVAGVAVWLFKKKFSRDDDDDQVSPFDRDEFRRASVMLDDVDEAHHYEAAAAAAQYAHSHGHSPQMSEYSMHEMYPGGATGLGRSETLMSNGSGGGVLPGLARGQTLMNPRPPTMISNHYAHHQQQQQQFMPSYAPGQVVPSVPQQAYHNGGASMSSTMDLYGNTGGPGPYAPAIGVPAGTPYGNAQQLDRSLGSANAGSWRGGNGNGGGGAGDLSRNNSQLSSYSQISSPADAPVYLPAALRAGGSSHGHGGPGGAGGYPDERPLSRVHEDDEAAPSYRSEYGVALGGAGGYGGGYAHQHQHQQMHGESLSRSGTPTNANVQQTFFEPSHTGGPAGGASAQAQDAKWDLYHGAGSAGRAPAGPSSHAQSGVVGQAWSDEELSALAGGQQRRGAASPGGDKLERRLSIRNGGLDAYGDDEQDAAAYGGMH
ncbi:hypothetical protein JCM3775_004927 [Rhodotorula graminis]